MASLILPGENQVPGQHAGDAGDLLLLVHPKVVGNIRLEVECHFPRHPEIILCMILSQCGAESAGTWSVWTGGPWSEPLSGSRGRRPG